MVEGLVGVQADLVGEDPGDAFVEPVEHDPGAGEGVALEIGHPGRAELGEGDDDEAQPGGAMTREPGRGVLASPSTRHPPR